MTEIAFQKTSSVSTFLETQEKCGTFLQWGSQQGLEQRTSAPLRQAKKGGQEEVTTHQTATQNVEIISGKDGARIRGEGLGMAGDRGSTCVESIGNPLAIKLPPPTPYIIRNISPSPPLPHVPPHPCFLRLTFFRHPERQGILFENAQHGSIIVPRVVGNQEVPVARQKFDEG